MQFSKDYFLGEERDGFYIEPMMKRAWASQIELLLEIDTICKKYGIRYFVYWGTLLGAVRHGGFIPWDDDIDIIMLRKDYEKFLDVANDNLPEGCKLLSIYTNPSWLMGASRVVNGEGIILEPDRLKKYHGCPFSLGIDITVYDYIPDDEGIWQEQKTFLDYIQKTIALIKSVDATENEGKVVFALTPEINERIFCLEDIFKVKFNRGNHILNQMICLYDQVYAMYGYENDTYLTAYEDQFWFEAKGIKDYKICASWIEDTEYLKFENIEVPVPKEYKLCLEKMYGKDYMTPIKIGVAGHDYPIYARQMEFMREQGLEELYLKSMELIGE